MHLSPKFFPQVRAASRLLKNPIRNDECAAGAVYELFQ